MRALMWFRSDLRVEDNTALAAACAEADEIVGVFVVSPEQWGAHDWGAMKVDFVLRDVLALREELQALNIPLLLLRVDRFADVAQALLDIADGLQCEGVWFNDEYEVNERDRDERVERSFSERGLRVVRHADQTIVDVTTIRTKSGDWYTVFTPFKRRWLEIWRDDGGLPTSPTPRKRERAPEIETGAEGDLALAPAQLANIVAEFDGTTRPDLWPAGEREAQRRLARFVAERIRDYDQRRDFMAVNGTSVLSPYLACGVVSARQCFEAARAANQGRADGGANGISTWISELIWREFYRHVLVGYPRVCRNQAFRREVDQRVDWQDDERAFDRWRTGQTGYPIVDAAMRQLEQTGWMHNRARMIVAMFLTKHLLIDWRWGERHFMRRLVDGDFASNNGGWQWSAATGTDAAPYFRIFNPFSQSKKFDADGDYIRRFVPELADAPEAALHDPDKLSELDLDYPAPIIQHAAARERALSAFGQGG